MTDKTVTNGDTRSDATPPVLDGPVQPKTWYIYLNEGHRSRFELILSTIMKSGTEPLRIYSDHPCGEPALPHCHIRVIMSADDILGHGRVHIGELYPAFDDNGDCIVFVQPVPGVDS